MGRSSEKKGSSARGLKGGDGDSAEGKEEADTRWGLGTRWLLCTWRHRGWEREKGDLRSFLVFSNCLFATVNLEMIFCKEAILES